MPFLRQFSLCLVCSTPFNQIRFEKGLAFRWFSPRDDRIVRIPDEELGFGFRRIKVPVEYLPRKILGNEKETTRRSIGAEATSTLTRLVNALY